MNYSIHTSNSSLPPSTSISYETLQNTLTESTTSLPRTKQIHASILTNGFSSKSVFACRLITSYASLCGLKEARQLFDSLPKRATGSYNHLLKAYFDLGQPRLTFKLYSQMLSNGQVSPDAVTFSIILKACLCLGSLRDGRIVHGHVLLTGCISDMRLATDILGLYSKCGCVDFARKQFEVMPQTDAFVWTTMIDGHLRFGDYREALRLLSSMRESGLKANAITWNAIIAGFARDGLMSDALYQMNMMRMNGVRPDNATLATMLPLFAKFAILKPGLEAHAYAVRNGFEIDLFVVSALVDMYAKCGKLELARRFFDRVELKDTGVWNAIICGYGMGGYCEEALSLFDKMTESGIRPNEITFTSVISACSHGGFLSEGRRVFDKMVFDYKIMARREHYACIVDMLGRAGQLEEASEVIRSMPLEPTEDIWGAFLSAFRTHHDKNFTKTAATDMLESNETGEIAGYHAMMSTIFAESGRWSDMAKLRTQIRDAGLKRRTGYSWIEVGDNVCTFSMGDMSNPQANEICSLLRNLNTVISSKSSFSQSSANLM